VGNVVGVTVVGGLVGSDVGFIVVGTSVGASEGYVLGVSDKVGASDGLTDVGREVLGLSLLGLTDVWEMR
jgi:hypothetical protein